MYTFARLAFIVVEISQFENQLVQKLKKLLCNAKGGELMTHGHRPTLRLEVMSHATSPEVDCVFQTSNYTNTTQQSLR